MKKLIVFDEIAADRDGCDTTVQVCFLEKRFEDDGWIVGAVRWHVDAEDAEGRC